jgi:hypothetical protein
MGTRTRHGGPCNAGACRWDTYASLHRRAGPRTLSLPAPQLGGLGWEYVLVHNGGAGTAKPERRRRRPAARRLRGGRSWGTVFVDGIKKKVKIIREGTTAQCRRQRWWSVGAWRQPAAELGNATPFRISSTLKLVCSPHDPSFSTFFCVLVTSTARISYIASFCLSFLLPD